RSYTKNKTNISEFIGINGSTEQTLSSSGYDNPYSLAKILRYNGYITTYLHDNYASFYNREEIIKNSNELLLAYGSSIDNKLHNRYLELLKNIIKNKKDIKLYTYAQELTKNGRPRHLSLQSYNNVQNKRLYELKIVEDKYQVQSDRAEFSFISINNQL
ncbi:MAG: hypothetical protein J6T41_03415, partial [Neisseriaceae bacterium]|nr:hypothetical protein [Neisseriaceae bacterium]